MKPNFWNNLTNYMIFALLGGFIAFMMFKDRGISVDIDAYQLKIEMLEQKIDSINQQNSELKLEADSLSSRISEYDIKIQKLNSRIYVIKKQTEQKLDAVDNFGDDELERFFADRYRQYKDSIN